MGTQTVLLRKEVPSNATWNWGNIFSSYQDWEAELKTIQAELSQNLAYQGRLYEGPCVIADALEARQEIARRVAKVLPTTAGAFYPPAARFIRWRRSS